MRHWPSIIRGSVAAAMSACVLLPLQALAHDDHGDHSQANFDRVEVKDAWSPTSPPTVSVRAVYFELINGGTGPVVVTGAESSDFGAVTIHDTSIIDGLTRMVPIEQLTVPAGKHVSFRPHGLHLMLTSAARDHQAGDLVPIDLHFADGSSLTFAAQVRKADGMPHHHHDHSGHEVTKPDS